MSEGSPQPDRDPVVKPSAALTARDSWPAVATVADASPPPAAVEPSSGPSLVTRFLWLAASLLVIVLLPVVLPHVVERVQYAITRGKERAEAEAASQKLGGLVLVDLSKAYQAVSKRVGPSVVHINVTGFADVGPPDEFAGLYRFETRGQGSGVIVDPAGYVLTNYHVVLGATEILVTLSGDRKVEATVVGADAPTDLAVLKIPTDGLISAEWGDSDELEVGALVWAVGSPFGLQRSITCGILSAKNRSNMAGHVFQDYLQTDAAVNPGNSGGPLVDALGRVIGICTAIAGESYQGISFAIPSSVARPVYERLKSTGHVERGWLGVSLGNLDEEAAKVLGLSEANGARVAAVVTDRETPSPAQQAGIRPDDVILRWNGIPIKDPASLTRLVARTEIGSTAEVVLWRRSQEVTVQVIVGRRPVNLD